MAGTNDTHLRPIPRRVTRIIFRGMCGGDSAREYLVKISREKNCFRAGKNIHYTFRDDIGPISFLVEFDQKERSFYDTDQQCEKTPLPQKPCFRINHNNVILYSLFIFYIECFFLFFFTNKTKHFSPFIFNRNVTQGFLCTQMQMLFQRLFAHIYFSFD